MFKRSIFGYRVNDRSPFHAVENRQGGKGQQAKPPGQAKVVSRSPGIPSSASKLRRVLSSKTQFSRNDSVGRTREGTEDKDEAVSGRVKGQAGRVVGEALTGGRVARAEAQPGSAQSGHSKADLKSPLKKGPSRGRQFVAFILSKGRVSRAIRGQCRAAETRQLNRSRRRAESAPRRWETALSTRPRP